MRCRELPINNSSVYDVVRDWGRGVLAWRVGW
jgi:hypothetical protein